MTFAEVEINKGARKRLRMNTKIPQRQLPPNRWPEKLSYVRAELLPVLPLDG
jgi:hypothetical protein